MGITVKNDKLTLAVAKATQVYLDGLIDTSAPQRFEAMLRAGKIPSGSDVYLDIAGGDVPSAMALGKLLRAGEMVTHVGALRRPGQPPKAATCYDACTWAYVGGLYRWTTAGADRIGLPKADFKLTKPPPGQAPSAIATYLASMDIDPAMMTLMPLPANDDAVWFGYDPQLILNLANNGRLPLQARYATNLAPPTLTFTQTARGGENKVILVCAPTGITLTAYYKVGVERARQLQGREMRSYFEINQQELMPRQTERARLDVDTLVFSRPLSLDQLKSFLATYSMGAWMQDRAGVVRYGFTMGPARLKASYPTYLNDCLRNMRSNEPRKP